MLDRRFHRSRGKALDSLAKKANRENNPKVFGSALLCDAALTAPTTATVPKGLTCLTPALQERGVRVAFGSPSIILRQVTSEPGRLKPAAVCPQSYPVFICGPPEARQVRHCKGDPR